MEGFALTVFLSEQRLRRKLAGFVHPAAAHRPVDADDLRVTVGL
jgi:hypothetical protein